VSRFGGPRVALGISERMLCSLTRSGEVPYVRIRRRVLYAPEDLRPWFETLKNPPELPSQG